jgi:mannose/cellobiose epimerase-like protein (N-acyl-D-glucosamine 2-epimerase family)
VVDVSPSSLAGAAPPPGGPSADWLLDEADRLLTGAVAARATSGGFGWLDDSGTLDPNAGRPLWITTRMTHCFSLGALLGRPGDAELAGHGIRALLGAFRDAEYGGWFGELSPGRELPAGLKGPAGLRGPAGRERPAEGVAGSGLVKGAYGHAFVVLAGASATVAGCPGGAELLAQALGAQEAHFWDDAAGAVVEEWDRAWTTCDPYRGANANMHTVEAYLAAADATGDPVWRRRALRIATRIVDAGARRHDWRLPEHHDADWVEQPEYHRDQPAHPFRPFGVTPGHGL